MQAGGYKLGAVGLGGQAQRPVFGPMKIMQITDLMLCLGIILIDGMRMCLDQHNPPQ